METQKETIRAILLRFRRGMVLYPPYDSDGDNFARCYSNNAMSRSGGDETVEQLQLNPNLPCPRCRYAQWTTNDRGKRVKPPCALTTLLLMFDVDDEFPFIYTIRRSANPRWDKLQKKVVFFGNQFAPDGFDAVNLCASFLMSTEHIAKNDYFIPEFSEYQQVGMEMIAKAAKTFSKLVDHFNAMEFGMVAALDAEQEAMDNEGMGGGGGGGEREPWGDSPPNDYEPGSFG